MAAGRATGTHLSNPDFKKYAESFGIQAYQPQNLKELERDLKTAVQKHELCLVDIPVDPSVNDAFTKKSKR
jgi:acetolactate synthase-1/2/3 large subunit